MEVRASLRLCCVWTAERGFWGEVMDETLGCRVISLVSVGAGILNRYRLLKYLACTSGNMYIQGMVYLDAFGTW